MVFQPGNHREYIDRGLNKPKREVQNSETAGLEPTQSTAPPLDPQWNFHLLMEGPCEWIDCSGEARGLGAAF